MPTPKKANPVNTRGNRTVFVVPEAPEGEVVPPTFLDEDERRIWDRDSPDLIKMKTLRPVDAPLFGMYCSHMSQFERFGSLKHADAARKLGEQFGMTPAARNRLGVGKNAGATNKNPFENFGK